MKLEGKMVIFILCYFYSSTRLVIILFEGGYTPFGTKMASYKNHPITDTPVFSFPVLYILYSPPMKMTILFFIIV